MMAAHAYLWHIYFVQNCRHVKPAPKDKFVVIVCIDADGKARGCFINSRISEWLNRHSDLLACEADILAQDHIFLAYDSHVDCQNLYPFTEGELVSDRELVSERAKASILEALSKCPTIPTKYKRLIFGHE